MRRCLEMLLILAGRLTHSNAWCAAHLGWCSIATITPSSTVLDYTSHRHTDVSERACKHYLTRAVCCFYSSSSSSSNTLSRVYAGHQGLITAIHTNYFWRCSTCMHAAYAPARTPQPNFSASEAPGHPQQGTLQLLQQARQFNTRQFCTPCRKRRQLCCCYSWS
jgi:hypothetical protein